MQIGAMNHPARDPFDGNRLVLMEMGVDEDQLHSVPDFVLRATCNKMEKPSLDEGFDKLFSVRVGSKGNFVVKALR